MSRSLHQYEQERLQAKMEAQAGGQPTQPKPVSMMTIDLKHGGMFTLFDPVFMGQRLSALGHTIPHGKTAADMSGAIGNFFSSLVPNSPYVISSPLVSYLTLPGKGRMVSNTNEPSPQILAVFTFVGQFIDHDLTLNGLNLLPTTTPAQGAPPLPAPSTIVNEASPLIDLDHVYGPRVDDAHPERFRETSMQPDGFFRMRKVGDGYDACRNTEGKALIGDKRNEDNQILLQLHVLIMRLHNAFMRELVAGKHDKATIVEEARRLTTLNWQSMVATEYLPLVVRADEIKLVSDALGPGRDVNLKYKPVEHSEPPKLQLPHEFSIGFRFGHSQLRSRYRLQPGHSIPLFDNVANDLNDLQGGRPLLETHVIDWPFFLGQTTNKPDHSNLIDTKITEIVFDLPQSTIPDHVELVGDLPFRNLARSNQLGICSGEQLAAFYNSSHNLGKIRVIEEFEIDAGRPDLFKFDNNGKPGAEFRTPLWYYLLREAEIERDPISNAPSRLGHLGSRLVAEVILSGIYYSAHYSFLRDAAWESTITKPGANKRQVTLWDIARFATKSPTEPKCL